ncbi:ubiquitin-associated- domain-containing protein [Ignisphaera aggregans DSM 17230]|uniref:Nascent polypeptide-associated complex protein n=1 Tax=Ignisphaera aggregans (strain DSM 17230 / JCM 13409 / AQ1.S1) TaxID=583356 RepID=E0SR18_IGNAA|nr:ubiquitin-associated- domain-containing protein [Ignisphaera aggregans DSM 17230]
MLPINPRELQKQLKQLKRMGVKIESIENVERVSIEMKDKILVLNEPEVIVFEMGNQKIFYVTSQDIHEEAKTQEIVSKPSEKIEVGIKDEDVSFIAEYAGVSMDEAREALIEAQGDIARAIELIQQRRRTSE